MRMAFEKICARSVARAAIAAAIAASAAACSSDTQRLSSNPFATNNGAQQEVTGSVPLCKRPRHLQLGPDRSRLFVACSDGNHIAVWDIASRKVVDKLDVGSDPEMFDISPDGRMLYVSNEEDSALTAYDLVARKKLFEVKVGGEPEGVKVSADGKTVYVTSEVASMVHVIDVAGRKIVKNIQVGKRPRRLLLTASHLWVSNELGASVSLIALADHTVKGTIDFTPPGMRPAIKIRRACDWRNRRNACGGSDSIAIALSRRSAAEAVRRPSASNFQTVSSFRSIAVSLRATMPLSIAISFAPPVLTARLCPFVTGV